MQRPDKEVEATAVPLRGPDQVMSLSRMGAAFPTRLSFMRAILRRMAKEGWRVSRPKFDLNEEGYGQAVYRLEMPERVYSLVVFSHELAPEMRTDRVIAEAWDATFSLVDGEATDEDIKRLSHQTPRQEAGRYSARELVLSRANKSVRLFAYVVDLLAKGLQPDASELAKVGYLMRTTAVYGNGKFGMADRTRYADRPALAGPFRAELIAVFLIRAFTFDLIEHVARQRNPAQAVALARPLKRMLGIGNATGLGMAPFLISHPSLIHNWYSARETALARVRALEQADGESIEAFQSLFSRAQQHVAEWRVEDELQSQRIFDLEEDLKAVQSWLDEGILSEDQPWNRLYRKGEESLTEEGQELLLSLILEPHGALVDDLAEGMETEDSGLLDVSQSLASLRDQIEQHYAWARRYDFAQRQEARHFWYYADEKIEPRRGDRFAEPGAEKEMTLATARDLQFLEADLRHADETESLAVFLLHHPQHRHMVRRVQRAAKLDYAEIRDNLIGARCRPVDILRSKLAYFGAAKFDPKSDLWTRITMYAGAPLVDEVDTQSAEGWAFAVTPENA